MRLKEDGNQNETEEKQNGKIVLLNNKANGYKPNYFWALFMHKCPRCRRGNMFKAHNAYHLKHTLAMNKQCSVCEQPMEIETGFYYGTGYVSYALSVAFSVTTFVAWYVIIGFSINDNRIFWWLGTNAALLILCQPYMMRLSRTLWLSFFVKYNPDSFLSTKKTESSILEQSQIRS